MQADMLSSSPNGNGIISVPRFPSAHRPGFEMMVKGIPMAGWLLLYLATEQFLKMHREKQTESRPTSRWETEQVCYVVAKFTDG